VLSSLTAGTPAAGPLSDLIAQVTALVGTTPSGDLGKLDPLLSALAPVLGTAGLDSSRVAALGSALTSLVGSGDPTSGAAAVLGALGLLGTVPGTTTPGGTTTTPGGTTTTPGGTTTTPTVTVARGKLGRLKVAGNRKSVRVTLRSAAATSVYVAGTVRSKAAFKGRFIALPGGVTVVKFKLSKAARKGGSLKVTVATAGSTATPVSKRVKIKRVTRK
ncbi:MAG: hypothetical protein QOF76_920, partial [Solirubrobacteraceae bacterium]|nr:hypothetical protein [Solirubrobacteraceae bacterium]